MEISKNEVNYFKSIVEHLYYVGKAQKYIREQFGFESEYDDENSVFTIKSNGVVNESLNLATAKQYVMENVDCVTVVLD